MPERWITLEEYQRAERVLAHEAARFGLLVHAVIFVLLSALLVVIELTLIDDGSSADSIPWSALSIGGMGLGLAAHWWFGYLNLETDLEQQQQKAEARAAEWH
jgi:2TM domain